ncbi:MAG: methyltransferase family protein, partial [Bryobacteraceae bacterium]
MILDPLRLYLLAGLVLHKAIWELLRPRGAGTHQPPTAIARLLKAVKIAVLAGLVVQTLAPDILPISTEPARMRIIGAALFTAGLALAVAGRLQLGGQWRDLEDSPSEGLTRVVDHGVYGYLRHPIYSGDLLLLFGFELACNSWLILGVMAMTPFVIWRAMQEETILATKIAGYRDYCRRTKRFVPYLFSMLAAVHAQPVELKIFDENGRPATARVRVRGAGGVWKAVAAEGAPLAAHPRFPDLGVIAEGALRVTTVPGDRVV